MGRDGKLGFKKTHEIPHARDLATSPSLPNMTSTISASVIQYNSVKDFSGQNLIILVKIYEKTAISFKKV